LVDLLVSDRWHGNLPEHVNKYLTTLEITSENGWLRSASLAETLDTYFSIHRYDGKPIIATSVTSHADNTVRYNHQGRSNFFNASDKSETISSKPNNEQSIKQVMDARNGGQNRQQSLGFRSTVSTGIDKLVCRTNLVLFVLALRTYVRIA